MTVPFAARNAAAAGEVNGGEVSGGTGSSRIGRGGGPGATVLYGTQGEAWSGEATAALQHLTLELTEELPGWRGGVGGL